MNRTLLTYNECREIVERNEDMKFYETKHVVDGYDVSIFNYKLAWYNDFAKPLEDSDIRAEEMRGITFVFDKDGTIADRFLMLHKFWNVNQVEESLLSNISDFKVKSVMNKEDGSLASFIKLPNGTIAGRSKASFSSDQAIRITHLYNTVESVKNLVDWGFDNDLALFFEYVAPTNKIVLDYKEEELILLRVRNNTTGEYLDVRDLDTFGVKVSDFYDYTLEEISEMVHTVEGTEGWIVEFENGYMVKWKTEWYFTRHKLFTESLNRENDIIKLILDEKIDDVLAQLTDTDVDKEKREFIGEMIEMVNHEVSMYIHSMKEKLKEYDGNVKAFALNNRKDPLFSMYMSSIKGRDTYDIAKEKILKSTSHLMQAKRWVEKRRKV
ncbi:MAG: RNA ligase A [uncultured marine phage]|uniref:RNA ligase A n=1 Tax=uncultured marine phage TaxID=707152 RepID=A0A8D9FR15_9VIRU|nr:MAG: RNA ligase A [uncultured marine phage]